MPIITYNVSRHDVSSHHCYFTLFQKTLDRVKDNKRYFTEWVGGKTTAFICRWNDCLCKTTKESFKNPLQLIGMMNSM
jgi:hypothetical protein